MRVALLIALARVGNQATNIIKTEPVDSVLTLANTGSRGMTDFQFEESRQTQQTKVAEVAEVANEVAKYLHRSRVNTTETLEGILEWWIPQQRILEERY